MATGTDTAVSYGISEALLIVYPELKNVYELFKAGNEGAAIEALFKTNYYKNTSATVKQREKQKLEQPKVYADSVQKYKLAAQRRLVQSGIQIDTATFDSLVNQAFASGMDDNQLDQAIATSGKISGFGGNILVDTTALKTYSAQFGVNTLLNDAYWNQKSKDLFSGTVTTEDIQNEIKTLASSAYPAYADGFAIGQSLDSQTSNIKQTIASRLEVNANTIDYNHPLMKKLINYQDPTTKKPAKAPQYFVERTVKSDSAWAFTNNARNEVDPLVSKVFKDMGFM
jgi:hypothetical protein